MAEAPERLRAQQFELTRHLRDPQASPAPAGIEDRRLAIYRDLFFNNIESLLSGNFPVICQLLGAAALEGAGARLLPRPPLPHAAVPRDRARVPALSGRCDRRCARPAIRPARTGALRMGRTGPADRRSRCPRRPCRAGRRPARRSARCCRHWPGRWPMPGRCTGSAPTSSRNSRRPPPPCCCCDAKATARCASLNSVRWHFACVQRLHESPELSGREQLQALAVEAGSSDTAAFVEQGRVLLEQMRATDVVLGTRRANPSA